MKQHHGWSWVCALSMAILLPAVAFGQDESLVPQVEAEPPVPAPDDEEADAADARREISVSLKRDGKTLAVTQTVDGDFVGEIMDGDETETIKAASLEELKEKSPELHKAFTAKPANPVARPGFGGGMSIQVTDNNGDRKIETKEPGRKTTIRDHRGKEIEITVVEDITDGTRTERVEAPDAAALRKKSPEMARVYDRYRQGGGVQVQAVPFGQIQIGGLPAPLAGPRKIVGEHNGRKVTIRDDGGKDIRIKLTKTVDGKEESEEFKADDLDDLTKKHPEVAKIYENLAGKELADPAAQLLPGSGPVPIQIGVQGRAGPLPVIPQRRAQGVRPSDLEFARRQLESSRRRLERLADDPDFAEADAARELADEAAELEKKIRELEEKTKR